MRKLACSAKENNMVINPWQMIQLLLSLGSNQAYYLQLHEQA